MAQIGELAEIVRSKNAGPFRVTFDLFFDEESYTKVKESQVINPETVSELYNIPEEDVISIYELDEINAVKFSIKRPVPSGHPADRDIFSAQQHEPLLSLETGH